MKIAQVAPLWIPVPPYTYGGTELVISWLSDELVKRGHQVTLFATGDSKTEANLVPIWPKSLWRSNLNAPHAVFALLYKTLSDLEGQFDIIHDHCEFYTSPFSKFFKTPIVSTLHHPMYEEMIILFKKFPKINYVAISKSQRRSAPGVNFVKTIYHGLPTEKYPFNPEPKDYLFWLSKISPEKGIAEAIEIAQRAGEKLIISGVILKEHQDFFEYRIKPMIDGKQIQFVGAADFEKKVELFKNAKAFLYPIKRPEPFGLVVIESMACGTPVLAYKAGAMPELIKHGKTGFLLNSQEEMVGALKKINEIKRIDCHRHILRKFSLQKTVNKYEALYHKILKNEKKKKT
ncbi:hypothetical protein AMJ50_00260 [Parcubacteria bacterium DG_74_3]|nr:MAG: hypothetical protein AMJ50_00260 [Parcubacteria bacterium DG_74_3]